MNTLILPYFQNEFFLLDLVSKHHSISKKIIIAIDEVGRGCVAGPVRCCASIWVSATETTHSAQHQTWLPLINDSKKLSEKKRNECFAAILTSLQLKPEILNTLISNSNPDNPSYLKPSLTQIHWNAAKFLEDQQQSKTTTNNKMVCIQFALGESSAQEVDSYNIWQAVQLAAARALNILSQLTKEKLNSTSNIFDTAIILMDGKHFLNVPNNFTHIPQITVTQADSLFKSVGFSSIIAKVSRDNYMISQDKKHPLFGFAQHKGYGTAKHLSLIKDVGTCTLHRKSFLTQCQKTTLS